MREYASIAGRLAEARSRAVNQMELQMADERLDHCPILPAETVLPSCEQVRL